jgi:F-type H+-transporting ATPase subunit delta
LIDKNLGLKATLEHPRVKAEEKMEALQQNFGQKLSQTMENFLLLLISKKRVKYLRSVAGHYERLCYEKQGKSIARVVTAMPLSPAQKQALVEKISVTFGVTVEIREEIRPQLIGGMMIYMGDQRMDGSILGQLEKMKQRLIRLEL